MTWLRQRHENLQGDDDDDSLAECAELEQAMKSLEHQAQRPKRGTNTVGEVKALFHCHFSDTRLGRPNCTHVVHVGGRKAPTTHLCQDQSLSAGRAQGPPYHLRRAKTGCGQSL